MSTSCNLVTYDASKVQIIISRIDPNSGTEIPLVDTFEQLSGFGEGDFITISYDEDIVNFRTGADGKEVASCNAAANTGTITISAIPGCPLDRALFALAFPRNSDFKLNVFSISIYPNVAFGQVGFSDETGFNEYYYSNCAVIVSRPDISLGTELSDRTYTIRASNLVITRLL